MQSPSPEAPLALVVEDDELIAQLLKFIVARAGYRVVLAPDGRQAQQQIEQGPRPAVALFDVMLPFVDGYQLVAMARRQPGWEGLPILMLTAKAQERDIARAMEAGADDYLAKPFQPDELLARLRKLAPLP